MKAGEVLRFAFRGLAANKLRSGLTTLGITIGVAAVILLVALGSGASAAIEQSIAGLGTNVLTVTRAGGKNPTARPLTLQDAKALVDPLGAPDVKASSPVVSTPVTAVHQGTSYQVPQLIGTTPEYFTTSNSELASGALFTADDVAAGRRVMVIGPTTAQELFGTADPVGRQVLADNIQFTVAGVLRSKGASGLNNADDTAVAPVTAVQNSLTGYGELDQILVQATSSDSMSAAQAEITAILTARHRIGATQAADFRVLSQQQLLATRTATTEKFTVLLASVAAISLLVGGIGVTNIMLVTVTERIREIGIRKAIGATRGGILGQFLAEATLLSLFGGALGVAVGVVGSQFTIAGITPVVVPGSIVLAFVVSALIGLFFGSYPAGRAAALRPMEALRHD